MTTWALAVAGALSAAVPITSATTHRMVPA